MDTATLQNYTYSFTISEASAALLDEESTCMSALRQIITAADMNELGSLTHRFTPQGVSIILLLAESHIALHTWPELSGGYVTLTTCKQPADTFTSQAIALLQATFKARTVSAKEIN